MGEDKNKAAGAAPAAGDQNAGAGQQQSGGDGGQGGQGAPAADDKDALIAQLQEEKQRLNKALHAARQDAKGGKSAPDAEAIASEVEALKSKLDSAEKRGKIARFTQDEGEAEIALSYYEKLAQGVTDPAEQEKLMQRAAFLARTEKQGGDNPMARVAASMHGGSRGSDGGGVTAGAAELAKHFGVDVNRIKEGNRPPKNLYNA